MMANGQIFAVLVVALAMPGVWALGAAQAPLAESSEAPRVVTVVDNARRVTLKGNTRLEATTANDRGPIPGDLPLEHLQLSLKRSDTREAALAAYMDGLSDSGSANYHRWLTPAEFGARFGVVQADIDQLTDWLGSFGLRVTGVSPNRVTIDFSGSAAQVERAFGVQIHYYDVAGVRHMANAGDPTIPFALAPVVAGVVSLNDFRPRPRPLTGR